MNNIIDDKRWFDSGEMLVKVKNFHRILVKFSKDIYFWIYFDRYVINGLGKHIHFNVIHIFYKNRNSMKNFKKINLYEK